MATKIPQSIQERWQNLTPSNDFVFSKMMHNEVICKGLIETLLGFDIDPDKVATLNRPLNFPLTPPATEL